MGLLRLTPIIALGTCICKRQGRLKCVTVVCGFAPIAGVSCGQTPFVGDWLLEQNVSGLVKPSDQLHKSLDNTNKSVLNSEEQYSDSEHAMDEPKRRGSNTKRMERDTKKAGGMTSSSERKKFLASDSQPKRAVSCLGDMGLDSVFLESLGKETQPQIKKCQQPHPMKVGNSLIKDNS